MASAMINSKRITDLAKMLFGSISPDKQSALLANKFSQPSGIEGVDNIIPTSIDAAIGDQGGVSAGQLGSIALGAAGAHPFRTAGLIGAGMGNLGGLTDNDKFGGQLGGLALGGLAASQLAAGNPYLQAMLTMGGGSLGALFDKLRARKEIEQAQGYQNAGNPIAMLGRR